MKRQLMAVLAVVLVAGLISWGFWERSNKERLVNALEANYQREFYNTLSHVEQARVLLGKSLVTGSPKQKIIYFTEIWNRTNDAQYSLSQLPLKEVNLSASRKFLTQLGDYTYTLAKREAEGKNLTEKEYDQLLQFYEELGRFNDTLHELEEQLQKENFRWANILIQDWSRPAQANTANLDTFNQIEKRIQGLPSLIYDGPFSDHLELRKPRAVVGQELNKEQAFIKIQDILRRVQKQPFHLVSSGEVQGKIPAYTFTFNIPGSEGTVTVDISEQGGHLMTLINSRKIGARKLSPQEAEKQATEFLKALGFKNMVPTYTISQGNTQIISFAFSQEGVIIYPDLVKVKVALDSGEMVGLDTIGYLMAHHEREIPSAALTEAEVKEKINPRVAIENIRQAIIPLDHGQEVFTYEVKGRFQDETYLIYINALTGQEEEILKVIHQPEGSLTI